MVSVTPVEPGKKRKKVILLLALGSLLLFGILLGESSFDLPFINPSTPEQTVSLAAISAVVFLLFVTLTFVLGRNLIKLFAERRLGVLGSKFRTRLVIGSLLLSFTPVIMMFWFAYGLMNRSIERWFSTPVEEVRHDTALMARMLSNYVAENARSAALAIASSPETQRAFEGHGFSAVLSQFRMHESTLQGGFAIAIRSGDAEASLGAPAAWPLLKPRLPAQPITAEHAEHITWNGIDYILGSAPVGDSGEILVGMPLPKNFTEAQKELAASQQRYLALARARRAVRRTYMAFLWLLTGMVLLASMWLALFLSRLVTRPVVALAEATEEISRGNLDYRVAVPAADELGELVRSFNAMAAELATSREKLEASRRDLSAANSELDERRQHIETILESIPTGVLSLDAGLRVQHVNQALLRMLRPAERPPLASLLMGQRLSDLFPREMIEDLEPILRRADRMGSTTTQMEFQLQRARLNAAITVATLEHKGRRMGYVLVFEDLSDLLHAQKQAAWREVARRVAHEIKNPLTPITLSAERMLRHLDRGPVEAASVDVLRNCADTIRGASETLRTLVNEFATLARFPASQPQPANINVIVESALAMFNGRLDGINMRTVYASNLPKVMADAEAMKRAVANLVDNAAEAVESSAVKEIEIATNLVLQQDLVEITVADSGPGVTQELKERLFLPYFSTKQRGTGLGLAIVSRIVEDHHGSIRVEENKPAGARFILELPVALEAPGPHTRAVHA